MSGGTSDAGTDFDVDFGGEGDLGSDHATGFNRSLSADDYWAAADMPMSHCIDGRDDAVRARR